MKLLALINIFFIYSCFNNRQIETGAYNGCNHEKISLSNTFVTQFQCIKKINNKFVYFDPKLCDQLESVANSSFEKKSSKYSENIALRVVNLEELSSDSSDYYLPILTFGIIPIKNNLRIKRIYSFSLFEAEYSFDDETNVEVSQGLLKWSANESYYAAHSMINKRLYCLLAKNQ